MNISLKHKELFRAKDLNKLPMTIEESDREEWRLRAASKEEAKGHYMEKWKMNPVLFLRWVIAHPVHIEASNQHRFQGKFVIVDTKVELDRLVAKSKKRKKQMTKLDASRIETLHDKQVIEKMKKQGRTTFFAQIDMADYFPETRLILKWQREKEEARRHREEAEAERKEMEREKERRLERRRKEAEQAEADA